MKYELDMNCNNFGHLNSIEVEKVIVQQKFKEELKLKVLTHITNR